MQGMAMGYVRMIVIAIGVAVFATVASLSTSMASAETQGRGYPDGLRATGIYSVDGGYGLVDAPYAGHDPEAYLK